MSSVAIALLVALTAICASTVAPWLMGRQLIRANEAKERRDYARQDAVAEKLREDNEKLAERTEKVAELAAESADVASGKLDEIQTTVTHVKTLVNSDMTAMMEALLTSLKAQLASLKTQENLSVADRTALAELPDRIAELEAKVADRKRSTAAAEAADP